MDCDSSTDKAVEAGSNQVIWLAGFPCAGKTWLGDYLATRGWAHIDGDMGNSTKDPALKKKWEMLATTFQKINSGNEILESEWKPYYDHVCGCAREAMKTNN